MAAIQRGSRSGDPFVAMFVDEARVCARLGHPNIVQVFDFGEQDGELYMAMEYVDGTTGARLVRAAADRLSAEFGFGGETEARVTAVI